MPNGTHPTFDFAAGATDPHYLAAWSTPQGFTERTLLPVLVLALVAFVQVGGYTIQSVNFVAFALAACLLGRQCMIVGTATALACAPLLLANLFPFMHEPEFRGALLRECRELLAMAVILAAASYVGPPIDRRRMDRFIVGFLMVLTAYTALQAFCLDVLNRPMFFLDWRLYGGIAGEESAAGRTTTLPGYWAEFGETHGLSLGEALRIRPVGFYSEPSYLGNVVFVLFFAMTARAPFTTAHLVAFVLALITAVLSTSSSALLVLLIYVAIRYRQTLRRHVPLLIVIVLPVLIPLLGEVFDRLSSVSDASKELSGFIRVVKPFQNIADVFSAGLYFGVPSTFMDRILVPTEFGVDFGFGTDNAILNLIIFNGIAGALVLAVLWKTFAPIEFVFILLGGIFNGLLFGFDKAFLIATAIMYSRAGLVHHASGLTSARPLAGS